MNSWIGWNLGRRTVGAELCVLYAGESWVSRYLHLSTTYTHPPTVIYSYIIG